MNDKRLFGTVKNHVLEWTARDGRNHSLPTKAVADIDDGKVTFTIINGNIADVQPEAEPKTEVTVTVEKNPSPESVAAFMAEVSPEKPKQEKKPVPEKAEEPNDAPASDLNHHNNESYEADKAIENETKARAKARKAAKKAEREAQKADSNEIGSAGPRHKRYGSLKTLREEDRANYED